MMAPMLMFPLIAACAPSRAPTYSTIPLLGALAAPERALESTAHLQFWLPLSRALPTSRRLRMVSGPMWTRAREQAGQFPTAAADGVVRRRMMAPMLMFPLIAACAPSRAPTYSTIPQLGALAAPDLHIPSIRSTHPEYPSWAFSDQIHH
jgi:hypothetical protein